ncbi:hypothetical protein NKH28_23235 [Mesorhizobium sp. M1227]|uniref:hypothetical protein n=1 Tax=Mesorhizobium sp. M1227 TaxID=2957071 RepID=UPI003337C0FD
MVDQKQIVLTATIETQNPYVARIVLQSTFRQRLLGSVVARLKGMISNQPTDEKAVNSSEDDLSASIQQLSEAVRELTAVVRHLPTTQAKSKGKGK